MTAPLRVLHLHDKPPRGGGGVRRHVEDLVAGLPARGVACCTLRLERGGTGRDGDGDDFVLPVSFRDAVDGPARARFAAVLRDSGAEVAHLHLGFTALAPVLVQDLIRTLPVLVGLHDVTPFCPTGTRLTRRQGAVCAVPAGARCFGSLCAGRGGVRSFAAALLLQGQRRAAWAALLAAPVFAAPSRYIAGLARAAGVAEDRLALLPLGVAPGGAEAAPPSASDPPEIVYAGRLDRLKGVHVLMDAMAELGPRRFVLTICGAGPEAAALTARAATDPRLRLMGQLDRGALAARIGQARAVVFPSLIPESFGLSGVEAMALGRPVAGFAPGGAADWMAGDEATLIAPAGDAKALGRALARLIDDPALADRLGAAGRARAARLYGLDGMLDGLATLYRRAQAGAALPQVPA